MDPEPSQPLPGDAAPDGPDEAGWAERFGDLCEEQGPEDPVTAFYDGPDVGPPLDSEQESWELLTARAARDGAEYGELIARLAAAGYSESAHVAGDPPVPGSPEGPAAGFGQGRPLDTAAPSTVICGLADEASGEDRAFKDVTDDQLMGLVGARQRLVARQHWEELAAVAEFIRRRPHPEADPAMVSCGRPAAASDDAAADLAAQLHVTAGMAAGLIHLARTLATAAARNPAPPGASPSPAPTTGPSPTAADGHHPEAANAAAVDAAQPGKAGQVSRPGTARPGNPAAATDRPEPGPSGWTSPPSPATPPTPAALATSSSRWRTSPDRATTRIRPPGTIPASR